MRYDYQTYQKEMNLSEQHIDFRVDYSNLKIYTEYNTKDIKYPVVLSSPHSGRCFPKEFLDNTCLSEQELRSSEDSYVDELILPASEQGIPMIAMNLPRTFIDVSRDKIEIDDSMYFNHPSPQKDIGSRRCRVGLGVIHRTISQTKNIYSGLISYDEVQERITNVYDVYHQRLKQLVDRCYRKFGFCLLIDCHSMPSQICSIMNEDKPIDFSLGTLFDESCPLSLSRRFYQTLEDSNYRVELNRPYSGGFITFNYCQPRKHIFSLQMEVNRNLYMYENTRKKRAQFQRISDSICDAIVDISKFLLDFKK